MTVEQILERVAKKSYNEFMNYIDSCRDLIFNEEIVDDDDTVEVEVFILDDDEGEDFIGRYTFDENGCYIG